MGIREEGDPNIIANDSVQFAVDSCGAVSHIRPSVSKPCVRDISKRTAGKKILEFSCIPQSDRGANSILGGKNTIKIPKQDPRISHGVSNGS
uniref:Uncharacterized protein n=1 Tax=Kalanchoe fedtschenkoi TaxID=63787 RepID=A0A7N0TBI9_KALFE